VGVGGWTLRGSECSTRIAWFYAGSTIGHEFLYPKDQEKQIAQDSQQTVVATPASNNVSVGQ